MKKFILVIFILSYYAITFFSLSAEMVRCRNKLCISIMDVGQGDSILIRTPENKNILIDAGPDYSIDSEINKKFFYVGCTIHYILLTHAHSDHYEGIGRLGEICVIKNIMFNDIVFPPEVLGDFSGYKEINSQQIINSNDEFEIDNVYFKILWPAENFNSAKNINNNSIVVFLKYKDFEALFLGDAEESVLKYIDFAGLSPYISGSLDLVKVSHHGSINGLYKPFYDLFRPLLCVISVGRNNKFGHPDPQVISYLTDIGCKVKRTDLDGTIEVFKE